MINLDEHKPEIVSLKKLLLFEKLNIPEYQRPYCWSTKNVQELFCDIDSIVNKRKIDSNFKYRIGTIILHYDKNDKNDKYNIVDGQQRLITFSLICKAIDNTFENFITKKDFDNQITIMNINKNFLNIRERIIDKNKLMDVIENSLEVVVITVKKVEEAFQLFDSQNSRGKSLYPHDILKAYHLREMNDNESELMKEVKKWESLDNEDIYNLFNDYLFPIYNWSKKEKTTTFTTDDIDIYKGTSLKLGYTYSYRLMKAEPVFQLYDSFISGKSFFEFVYYYIAMLDTIKKEIISQFSIISEIIGRNEKLNNTGYSYVKNLFYCVLLCYYDRFKKIDRQSLNIIYKWSFQIRVDIERLGYDTINKYAIGDDNNKYSNKIPMFFLIINSRVHSDLYRQTIKINKRQTKENDKDVEKWFNRIFSTEGDKLLWE